MKGETWRTNRRILSPTFSISKVKTVSRSVVYTYHDTLGQGIPQNLYASRCTMPKTTIIFIMQMIPLVKKSVDILLALLEAKVASGEIFDITKYKLLHKIDSE